MPRLSASRISGFRLQIYQIFRTISSHTVHHSFPSEKIFLKPVPSYHSINIEARGHKSILPQGALPEWMIVANPFWQKAANGPKNII
jgi:hypothetical protein